MSHKFVSIWGWAAICVILVGLCSHVEAQTKAELHTTAQNVPVTVLDGQAAFDGLTAKEKLYAHWMSQASWWGALITFEQLSPESPLILELYMRLYQGSEVDFRAATTRAGLSEEDLSDLATYGARVLANCGNYLSFGDTKFIPRLSREKFAKAVFAIAGAGEAKQDRLIELWSMLADPIYSLDDDVLSLGIGADGVSAYYSDNITQKDIDDCAAFMKEKGFEAWNTRLTKDEAGGLHIQIASALEQPSQTLEYRGRSYTFEYGDYASILKIVVDCFKKALPHAANDHQRRMILAYIDHFNGGDIDDHKESQRQWILDAGPVVETNLGFIETYRDPQSVRAEWEGLVAVVNKEQTKKFAALVNAAPSLIPLLPWGKNFEKKTFRKPDFTSLEVICFASSGIPLGINIPNYNEIRQNFGFKNVSLGNVASGRGGGKGPISFISEHDQELFRHLAGHSFEVQVGLHELLGHGSGRLLREEKDGTFNFDRESVVSTIDNKPVTSWYKPGETWGSKFTTIASSYEECRAETVGLHLCTNDDVLKIFGYQGQEAKDIAYINWLSMARSGIAALTFFDPAKKKWGQAHMQARFAILQIMLRAGGGFIEVKQDGKGDWRIHLDREKIETVGAKAVARFLTQLNVYKATGDDKAGRALYADLSGVNRRFLDIRAYVLSKRKPRNLWVQPVTDINDEGDVIMRVHEASPMGVIRSFLDRYRGLFH